jgi:hypothetical protein
MGYHTYSIRGAGWKVMRFEIKILQDLSSVGMSSADALKSLV